ncbi:MAG: hypothetical protein WC479_04580 [Candidatus Izemoplasmatales bacterium]
MIKQSEINKAWGILSKKNTGDVTYADFDAAITEAADVDMDCKVLDPNPDNEETNPFGEEVDDFDKEEAPEEDPDLPYDENPDVEEIQP